MKSTTSGSVVGKPSRRRASSRSPSPTTMSPRRIDEDEIGAAKRMPTHGSAALRPVSLKCCRRGSAFELCPQVGEETLLLSRRRLGRRDRLYTEFGARVAQWIEQRFPKPRALVRFRPGTLAETSFPGKSGRRVNAPRPDPLPIYERRLQGNGPTRRGAGNCRTSRSTCRPPPAGRRRRRRSTSTSSTTNWSTAARAS